MDARTLLLGDWHPAVRDPIDLLRGALLVGMAVYAVTGPPQAAVFLAVAAIGALAARAIALPRAIDLALVLALSVSGWGEALGFYDRWDWFDRLVHVVVPMLFAPVAYVAMARADLVLDPGDDHPDVRHGPAMFAVAVAFGLALGAVWEIVEWTADATMSSNLSEGNDDTVGDLIADASGTIAGAALLVAWARSPWGSRRGEPRRRPG